MQSQSLLARFRPNKNKKYNLQMQSQSLFARFRPYKKSECWKIEQIGEKKVDISWLKYNEKDKQLKY